MEKDNESQTCISTETCMSLFNAISPPFNSGAEISTANSNDKQPGFKT